jgi:hypothetical protein
MVIKICSSMTSHANKVVKSGNWNMYIRKTVKAKFFLGGTGCVNKVHQKLGSFFIVKICVNALLVSIGQKGPFFNETNANGSQDPKIPRFQDPKIQLDCIVNCSNVEGSAFLETSYPKLRGVSVNWMCYMLTKLWALLFKPFLCFQGTGCERGGLCTYNMQKSINLGAMK